MKIVSVAYVLKHGEESCCCCDCTEGHCDLSTWMEFYTLNGKTSQLALQQLKIVMNCT